MKNKLKRFEAVKDFPNFFQPEIGEMSPLRSNWASDYFKNTQPIVLELGCGKGEYTVGLAQRQSHKNFIGIDIKGSRMYVGAQSALQQHLTNVAFCRTKIDFLTTCFAPEEVAEIWLTFSDPQPKKPNKRLSSPPFIQRYREILQTGGIIHLKTDSDLLFEYTLQQIKEHNYACNCFSWNIHTDQNIAQNKELTDILNIQTHYEKIFSQKGASIKYCQFTI